MRTAKRNAHSSSVAERSTVSRAVVTRTLDYKTQTQNRKEQMTPQQQTEGIRRIAQAIVEAVKEAGEFGAPSGIVYAALNAQGMTLDQYQQFIAALVKLGKLRQDGDLLHAV